MKMSKWEEYEERYLKISGLLGGNWTDEELREFLDSLEPELKREWDLYDENSDYCSNCIDSEERLSDIKDGRWIKSIAKTKNGKKCRYCGYLESV